MLWQFDVHGANLKKNSFLKKNDFSIICTTNSKSLNSAEKYPKNIALCKIALCKTALHKYSFTVKVI